MSQAQNPQSSAALNGLMTALLNGNPAVQNHMAQTGKSLDEILGSATAGQAPDAGATRGGLVDLFGGAGGGAGSGGGDILGSLLGAMLGGGGGGAPTQMPQQMPSQGAGGDALGGLLGTMLGDGGAPAQMPTQTPNAGGGDMLGSLLGSMLGGGGASPEMPQQMPSQTPTQGGGDMLGSLLGGMLGGGMQSGGTAPQQMPQQSADPISSLLGGVLGVNAGGGGGIANGFVAPIASAIAKKIGIPDQIAQVVVAFALQKIMSSAMGQGGQGRFNPAELVDTLATDGKVSTKYLKDSGLVADLAQQSGLDQKTATKSLQQAFAALGTHIGEANADEQQAALNKVLGKMQ